MRLWNAHKRVLHKRPLPYNEIRRLKQEPDGWRQIVTEDVVKFVDDLERHNLAGTKEEQGSRIRQILWDPAIFFSRPRNVPLELRKQVYLPEFVVKLMRTPYLPPKYASFWVPLWFSKLDFKSYLKNVYNVDVLHIRSYVQQQKVQRKELKHHSGIRTQGRLHRPAARKKMTVELVDPFVYPEAIKDLSRWDQETYKREKKEYQELSEELSNRYQREANRKERVSIAQQAQDHLEGKQRWKPSWQSIPADARIMKSTSRPPGIRGTI